MVIWFVGLSASGKSTFSGHAVNYLRSKGYSCVLLDGDAFREVFGNDVGHDLAGRKTNARRLSYLSKFLSSQGIVVVAAVLSIFPEWQKWNRENIPNYYQIWIDVEMDVLKKRETKSLYKNATEGKINNVVGIDLPFPTPYKSDLRITNSVSLADTEKETLHIMEKLNI